MKCRNMRNNLLFTNIFDHGKVVKEKELNKCLRNEMQIIDTSFERVHCIGRKPIQPTWDQSARPRVIVAKFKYFKDRERVKKLAKRLKGTINYGIQEQFSDEIEKSRKPIYPLLRQASKDEKKAVLVKVRLFIDGKVVSAGKKGSSDDHDEVMARKVKQAVQPNEGVMMMWRRQIRL